ncbi:MULTISPECIES: sigma-54 dependent transcriptional regulator [Roseobacteraceae]|jgi:DNA-binding NtrC family response regulator|uniref:C4-dicarboxylate transport transcriptional regulatory protein DctD n=2 Tax=Celeribacter baekdonensis TaxID=875171 RepID=K2JDF7_9RHOB|nr:MULTISPECIES: sigma-54 dependent transcriptional regulator [Roseobacteraceae]MBU0645495.1 sigma-54 dependent transcriptional regulator [Alphaproteobacteria bacterium]EKE72692.1 C4-dicarboxylate transport transcriptional regulatory protein DctD [Celeribacter baekdonensis B30]KAB6715348.1 sigma-54-dependent Fis family transcriptional regulator [Roseobacter sp. TSBP12]MBU1279032.1 sigma-54 dependent transcriptional regulator [Alphaproteobacteria bacterium]MBU1574806.1 sigma-54 dependent transc|tara:strand:- start:97 stop:1431 length:1335 start_codon:yes stop_codon:yes gene_type:complete
MATAMKIAIVDDEQDMRQSISQWLALSGFDTETFATAEEAVKALGSDYPGVVITDIKMPGMDGMQFLKKLMSVDSGLPVIMITGHGDVPMAVEAMRIGAFDFLEKPFNPDRMTELAKKATNARRLTLDNRALRRELSDGTGIMNKLIGASPVMERLREDILDLGQADGHVLIDGETGTGKTLIAHALHAVGARASKKFITFACAGRDEYDLSKRLFGPDPDGQIQPLFEEARGGTLVLEDIEAMPMPLQARLLTLINEQGTPPETRIIAICNLQEQGRTCESAMRPDLFYRLAAMKITTPPLRARGEDILSLFTQLSQQFAEEYGCDAPEVSAQEAAQLLQAPWPGNIRQLINVAERSVLQSRRGSGSITSLLLSESDAPEQQTMTTEGKPLKEYVEAFERMLIDNTMRRHKGSIVAVMDELCLPRRTLNEKMAKYSLQRADYL